MKIGIMQPYFFPYIGYFQLIHSVDRFLLYPLVQHARSGWETRNRIQIKWGAPTTISVPVRHCCLDTRIRDVQLSDSNWQKKLLKFLHFNYATADFYKQIIPLIEDMLDFEATDLASLNCRTIRMLAAAIGLENQIVCAGDSYLDIEQSLSEEYGSGPHHPSLDRRCARVLRLCRREGADTYVNPIGGTLLYSKATFEKWGVDLYFLDPFIRSYRQHSSEFQPRLSIIDVLMHNGIAETEKLVRDYKLI